jgi:hypothetical protein
MIFAPSAKKPVLSRDAVGALDCLHRAVIEVLADRGEVVIIDAQPEAQP